MKMKKAALLLALPLLLGTAATVVHAGGDHVVIRGHGPHGGPMNHGMFVEHLTEKLDLTAEQQAVVKEKAAQVHAGIAPLFAEHERQHAELRKALDEGADAATVGELAITAHATMKKIHAAHKEAEAALVALLTPEQAAKWEAMQGDRKMMFHHRIVMPIESED